MAGSKARRGTGELMVGGVFVAAALVLLGSEWRLIGDLIGGRDIRDRLFGVGVILNVAILLFGWIRYRDLVRTVAAADRAAPATLDPRTLHAALGRMRDAVAAVVLLARLPIAEDARDAVLAAVADLLVEGVPGAVAGRIGDDAVAIVVPETAGIAAAIDHAAARLAQPIDLGTAIVAPAAAIGYAHSRGREGAALLRRATIAARHAQGENDGRAVRLDAAMERTLANRDATAETLRAAVTAGQVVPWYAALADDRGYAVVPRWERADGAVLAPEAFGDLAEAAGIAADIDAAALGRALAEARDWDPMLFLAFAVAPERLADPWLAQKIVKLLVGSGFPAERLEIALPDAMRDDPLAAALARSLANQGVRIVRGAIVHGTPVAVVAVRRTLAERGLLPAARTALGGRRGR